MKKIMEYMCYNAISAFLAFLAGELNSVTPQHGVLPNGHQSRY